MINDILDKIINKKYPKHAIIYTVVHKIPQKNMLDINNGTVISFTKEQDAIDAAKYLNEQVKKFSLNSKYVVEILHVFYENFYK